MKWDDINNFGHWGIFDEECALYPEALSLLKQDLAGTEPFDTMWHMFKKECQSMRIVADNEKITVHVAQWMDDFPELICDCDGVEYLSDEQFEYVVDFCASSDFYFATELDDQEDLPRTATVEDIMKTATKIANRLNKSLEDSFNLLQELVGCAINNMGRDDCK